VHRELELLVEGGMSPTQALAAATSVPARAFHLEDRGRIAPGMRADLLLVEGDPTQNILQTRAIVQVWKRGIAIDRSRLFKTAEDDASATAKLLVPAGSEGGLISNFEDGTTKAGFGAGWIIVTDTLYRGKSEAEMKVVPGGSNGSKNSLLVTGQIRSGSPIPWAGVAFLASASGYDPANLSAFQGLRFCAKESGKLHVWIESITRPPTIKTFNLRSHWREYTALFSAFNASGSDITKVVFTSASQERQFSFQLDDVGLLRSKPDR
jgi:Amidohydrolase family